MNKGGITPGRVFAMAGFAFSCFSLLLFLWLAFGGPIPLKPKGYRVQAAFDDATTLAEQADVRSAGVSIGKVVSKKRDPQGNRTVATIELESPYAPLRRDARAILRQKTLLGETYVELTLGSKKAPTVPDGGRVSNAAVADTVEFDELLRIFDDRTRRDFQDWQDTLAEATAGRGRDFNEALGSLPIFIENATDVVDILDDRERNLAGLIRNTGQTFEAITRDERSLRTLIVRSRQVFDTLAARRDSVAETFQILPTFQRESRATFRRLSEFSKDTEPLFRDLEPVLEDAQPTVVALRQLAPDLEQIFEDLDPLIDAGRTGFPALSRVLRGLDPTLKATDPFLRQINPLLEYLEIQQASVTDFLNVGPSALGGKRAPAPGSQSLGHVLPQLAVTGDQSLPQARRSQSNRGNAYLAPDALDGIPPELLIPPSFDCKHIGGPKPPTGNGNPGCFVQGGSPDNDPPFTRYPRVVPNRAGGQSHVRRGSEEEAQYKHGSKQPAR